MAASADRAPTVTSDLALALDGSEAWPRPSLLDRPVAFVDVETTGGDPRFHRIIEIAIVIAEAGVCVERWSTLVNPHAHIPPHIEALTGISDEMVADAPTFDQVAHEVLARLEGRLFVAHNVSFDRTFVRTELARLGHRFNPRSLCTVRLSRRLNPQAHSHSLDSVIQRLGIAVQRRHRALDDALVLWELWQRARQNYAHEELDALLCEIAGLVSLPPHLPPELVDEIPETSGVYRFYGERRALLYVGKSRSLRTRVLSHFASARRNATDRHLRVQVRDIDWTETAGELGAELAEVRCIREQQPVYNKRLRASRAVYTVRLDDDARDGVRIRIEELDSATRDPIGEAYGLFRAPPEASRFVKRALREHSLCAVALGLEPAGGSCMAYQLGGCRGACVGEETARLHATRTRLALARQRVEPWPFQGIAAVRERTPAGHAEMHLFHQWRYLGTAASDEELASLVAEDDAQPFDMDLYRIVSRFLRARRRRAQIIEIAAPSRDHG